MVKKAKLTITPSTTPKGLLFPPVTELAKIIGKIGQIHGAAIVTSPEMNAKRSNNSIR